MPPTARSPRPGAVRALLCLLLCTGPAFAIDLGLPKAASEPAAASAPAGAEAIAPGDVPLRADIDERFVQDVILRARQKDPGARLGPRLDEIAAGIANLSRSVTKTELRELSAVRLSSLVGHWRFYNRELASWRTDLERTTSPYSEDAAALARRRATWEATQAALESSGVTSALSDRVRGILAQVTLAEQALSGPLDRQIKLGRRANIIQASIDGGIKEVTAGIDYYDRRLSMIDAPPLWDAWKGPEFSATELRGAEVALRIETDFLAEWYAASRDRILGYAITVVLALPLLLWLSYRSRGIVTPEPGIQAAARVLRRPVSTWFVFAFVGLPFYFPDAPLILRQVALLLAMIPVLRLLPPRVYDMLGLWPYGATALYVINRLRFPLLGLPLYFRLHLLGVALVTAAAITWMLFSRKHSPGGEVTPRVRGFIRFVGWLGVIALLVAVIANVIGNVTLAEMLTAAVVNSAYIGLALFAAANVLTSVMNLLLARHSVTRLRVITQHAGPLLESASKLMMLGALVIWVSATLVEFRIARPIYGWAQGVLTYPLEVGQISVTLRSILLFGFSVWIAFWIAKTVRFILRDEVLARMELPRGVGNSVSTLSYYALVVIGLLVALAAAGFETSQFAIVFGALGVGIGFGLQNVVNNFVSGLILMFERPIQPGDVVEVSGTSGKVRDIGMRATTLTTFDGADVVVPNGTLLSEKLINWTLSDMNRRLDVNVGVAYGTDPRRVLQLLEDVARATPGVAAEPAPNIVFMGFGASSLDFSIRAWTNDFGDWVNIRSQLTVRIYEALQQAGIEIPFPQQDLHLRSVSVEAGQQLGAVARNGKPTPAC